MIVYICDTYGDLERITILRNSSLIIAQSFYQNTQLYIETLSFVFLHSGGRSVGPLASRLPLICTVLTNI